MIPSVYRDLPLSWLLVWKPMRYGCSSGRALKLSGVILLCLALSGCERLRPKPKTEIVYVLAKETFLRDRVAAVSNRVGMVQNGDRLELLERGKRFLKVKTDKGEIGWIEEHAVVNPEVVTGFAALQKAHEHDAVVATAALRDDGYLHLKPGRDTDRYYLLPEADKLQLLLRASVPKAVGPQASGSASSFATTQAAAAATKKSARAKAAQKQAAEKKGPPPPVSFTPAPPAAQPASASNPQTDEVPATAAAGPVAMEDWWLVRDSQGKVGWVMSRRIDVDVPDAIAGYAEGQRIIAAYVLRKVDDPGSDFPDKQAPEYVTVLSPYQDGLKYDFSQVRVFTWSVKKHRYETAFRQHDLQGYLPVVVAEGTFEKGGSEPTFSFQQGIGDSVTIDPETGATKPTSTETLTYRLDNTVVKRVGPERPATAAPAGGSPRRSSPEKTKHHRRKHG